MDVITHYDKLIDEGNDPFNDPPILKQYMDKWDGELFIDAMKLDKTKNVLEIGVGTGRIAIKVIPNCKRFTGIDISPKTILRAKENLSEYENVTLICNDFKSHIFDEKFDVIYSSLTMMHFEHKHQFILKVKELLNTGGIFCLSIDKNQSDVIDMENRKLRIYPDTKDNIISVLKSNRIVCKKIMETEFAHIFVCLK